LLFSSITFILYFLPLTLLVYYCCPPITGKNGILLFFSLLFYAWGEPVYVLVMIVSIVLNYAAGLGIGKGSSPGKRRLFLVIGVTLNLLVLFLFKYLGFFMGMINTVLSLSAAHVAHVPELHNPGLVMPIGISFYTFQAISYLADVYKNPAMARKNPLNVGLYISFFPQLIAGPIVRYHDINEQIVRRNHGIENFSRGIERFITGLAKKALLANVFGELADGVFDMPLDSLPSFYLCLALLAYALQIYYDFSGYSDMAVGLGLLFGFSLPENFNYPYASRSVTEFWRRWHISLSTWFRDYLYIPLGGNRNGQARTVRNLFIVFLITGLWHGAAWNFVFWGLGHGIFLFVERTLGKKIGRRIKDGPFKSILSHGYTVCAVVALWIFFRLGLGDGLSFIRGLFRGISPAGSSAGTSADYITLGMLADLRFYVYFAAGILCAFPWWKKLPFSMHPVLRKGLLLCLLVLAISSLASDAYTPFIYFRF
jgi:alginate O-acetyltransferase complex protein AlgI